MNAEYYYRRKLKPSELAPALGVGIAAGVAGFYIVQLLIQRTSLVPEGKLRQLGRPPEPNRDPRTAREHTTGSQPRDPGQARLTALPVGEDVPPLPSSGPKRG